MINKNLRRQVDAAWTMIDYLLAHPEKLTFQQVVDLPGRAWELWKLVGKLLKVERCPRCREWGGHQDECPDRERDTALEERFGELIQFLQDECGIENVTPSSAIFEIKLQLDAWRRQYLLKDWDKWPWEDQAGKIKELLLGSDTAAGATYGAIFDAMGDMIEGKVDTLHHMEGEELENLASRSRTFAEVCDQLALVQGM